MSNNKTIIKISCKFPDKMRFFCVFQLCDVSRLDSTLFNRYFQVQF